MLPRFPTAFSSPCFRLLVALSAGLIPALVPLSAAPPERDAWALADRFDFNGALSLLNEAGANSTSGDPSRRLAHAAALLGSQPRTPANISAALSATRAVATAAETPADLRLVARYLEGRILREHLEPRTPENLAAARAIFGDLVAADTPHPLAVRAVVPLAFGLLYDEPARPAAERLAAAEALLPQAARHPAAERDLRYVLSQAALVWKLDPVIARDHLQRVDEIGFSQLPRRLAIRVALARLAEETGDLALAEKTYRAFLAESVRDSRENTIRAALAEVERRRARPVAPPGGPAAK